MIHAVHFWTKEEEFPRVGKILLACGLKTRESDAEHRRDDRRDQHRVCYAYKINPEGPPVYLVEFRETEKHPSFDLKHVVSFSYWPAGHFYRANFPHLMLKALKEVYRHLSSNAGLQAEHITGGLTNHLINLEEEFSLAA